MTIFVNTPKGWILGELVERHVSEHGIPSTDLFWVNTVEYGRIMVSRKNMRGFD